MLKQVLWVMTIYEIKSELKAFEIGLVAGKFCNCSVTVEFQLKLKDKCLIDLRLVW